MDHCIGSYLEYTVLHPSHVEGSPPREGSVRRPRVNDYVHVALPLSFSTLLLRLICLCGSFKSHYQTFNEAIGKQVGCIVGKMGFHFRVYDVTPTIFRH